jgi:hypothetical protein
VPVFLRVKTAMETTGTFKYQKNNLKKEGFDPAQVAGEPLFVLIPGTSEYAPLTDAVFADRLPAFLWTQHGHAKTLAALGHTEQKTPNTAWPAAPKQGA